MLPKSVYMLIGAKHRNILPDISFDADGLTIETCIRKMQDWIQKKGYTGTDRMDAHIVEISRPEYKAVTIGEVKLMDDGTLVIEPHNGRSQSKINENMYARTFLQQVYEYVVKEGMGDV